MDHSIVLHTFSSIARCTAHVNVSDRSTLERISSLFSCIGLLDRFLQQATMEAPSGFVTQKNLQLIAVATFLIAAKVEVSEEELEENAIDMFS
jgi:hypothetical protein